jgi:hypothetical protein
MASINEEEGIGHRWVKFKVDVSSVVWALSSHPNQTDTIGLRAFRSTYPKARIAPGLIIHAGEETYPIDPQTLAISWKAI